MSSEDSDPGWRGLLDTNPRYPLLTLERPAATRRPRRKRRKPDLRTFDTLQGLGAPETLRRRAFKAQVDVLPLNGRLSSLRGTADEIGHLGLFIHSRVTLPVGTLVRLQLHTELGDASFTAKVVQSVPRYGLGCAFVDLDRADRAILSRIVGAANSAPAESRTITSH